MDKKDLVYGRAEILIEKATLELFETMHREFKTESGDMSFDQIVRLDELKKSLADIVTKQVLFNM